MAMSSAFFIPIPGMDIGYPGDHGPVPRPVSLQGGRAIYKLAPVWTKFCHIHSLTNNSSAVFLRRIHAGKSHNYRTDPQYSMKNLSLILIAFVVLLLAGGATFLAAWEIPAPSAPVHKVLADDRFPR